MTVLQNDPKVVDMFPTQPQLKSLIR